MTSRSVAIRVYLSLLFIFLYYVRADAQEVLILMVDADGFSDSSDHGGFLDKYVKTSTAPVGHRIQLFRSAQGSF